MLRVMLLETKVESGVFMGDCLKSAAPPIFKRFKMKEAFEKERCTCFSHLFVPGKHRRDEHGKRTAETKCLVPFL